MRRMLKKEKTLWFASIFLTVLIGVVNSVLTVFLIKKIVEDILLDGVYAPCLLGLFALSILVGALLEILRQKTMYILYKGQVIRLEDKLILASRVSGSGGDQAFVLIQNTVNDFVIQRTNWVLECSRILGVSVILGIYIGTISMTALYLCLTVTGAALFLMWKSSRKISGAAEVSNEKMNAIYGEMWNYLRCKEILPFLQPKVYKKFEEQLDENQQAQILLGKYTNTARICMRFGNVGITLVAIIYFGILIIMGQFTLSKLLALAMLLPSLTDGLLQIPNCISQHKKLIGIERNVNTFLGQSEKIIWEVNNVAGRKKEPLKHRINLIEALDITYSYQMGQCSCRMDRLSAQAGSVTGICGESGVGKTTLVKILLGELLGYEGKCLINGRKLESFDRQDLWSHILYLPQNPVLLPVSLKENITLTADSSQIDEKRYAESLRKADIEKLAMEKEGKALDESGLSNGELQKVCLARCFYTDKEVFILDEATNAMSSNVENFILHNLIDEVIKKKKILVLVSHSSEVLDLCDTLVQIKKDGEGSI